MCKVIYLDDDFRLRMQVHGGDVYLHLDVYRMTKQCYKKMLSTWAALTRNLSDRGIDEIWALPLDATSLIRRLGFELYGTYEYEGKEMEMWVWV